jgi:hypothetical protein
VEDILSGGGWYSGWREEVWKRFISVNICKYIVHMYVNGKIIPIDIIPGMGEWK